MILLRRPPGGGSQDALLRPGQGPGDPPGWEGGTQGGPAGRPPQLPLVELTVLRLDFVDFLLESLDLQRDRDGSDEAALRLLHHLHCSPGGDQLVAV